MAELSIYFARAMDGLSPEEVLLGDRAVMKLLEPARLALANPFGGPPQDLIQDSLALADGNSKVLEECDLVLCDLSHPTYRYVGCIFEIAHAVTRKIPVVLIVGESGYDRRVYFQAYADFIARCAEEAVEYLVRAHTPGGVAQQLEEMKEYYARVAPDYMAASVKPDASGPCNQTQFAAERRELREVLLRHARSKVCEVGVGAGDWAETTCEVADAVLAIDSSREMLQEARRRLSRFRNVELLQHDILAEGPPVGEFDCVVIYFLFGLLPPSMQQLLLERAEGLLRPGGLLIVADTKRPRDVPAVGLGRRQLQRRAAGGEVFTLYKEHFVGDTLASFLRDRGHAVIDSCKSTSWFSWAVARVDGRAKQPIESPSHIRVEE